MNYATTKKLFISYTFQDETQVIAQMDAMLRFHYPQYKPEDLTDDEWAKMDSELTYVLKFIGTINKKEIQ